MTHSDLKWIASLQNRGLISGSVLELGAGYGGKTCAKLIRDVGLNYVGTDLNEGPGVDIAGDFECADHMDRFTGTGPFGTVLMLNVLEHTFDPIRVIDNAMTLISPGGRCIILAPSVWPLHNFPMDAWRILPNFFEEYATRRKVILDKTSFEWVGVGPVSDHRNFDGSYCFPNPAKSRLIQYWSRLVHRVFNTNGRGIQFGTYLGLGAVLQKPL